MVCLIIHSLEDIWVAIMPYKRRDAFICSFNKLMESFRVPGSTLRTGDVAINEGKTINPQTKRMIAGMMRDRKEVDW